MMETADLAGTGNLKLLFGLLETSNVLSLLGAVYPTETNTAVYGPLRKVDMDTWNKWAEAVGSNGVYGDRSRVRLLRRKKSYRHSSQNMPMATTSRQAE